MIAEEEGYREDVDGAHGNGGVPVRQPRDRRPRPPSRLGVHAVHGDGAVLAGEEDTRKRRKKRRKRTRGHPTNRSTFRMGRHFKMGRSPVINLTLRGPTGLVDCT